MGGNGKKQPSVPWFWEPAWHVPAAQRVFPREKGRLSRPCAAAALCGQHGAVGTTTVVLSSVCALPSAAEPRLSQGRQRLDPQALLLPQSCPAHCQGGRWRRDAVRDSEHSGFT